MRSLDGIIKHPPKGGASRFRRQTKRKRSYRPYLIVIAVLSGCMIGAGVIPANQSGIAVAPLVSSTTRVDKTVEEVVEPGAPIKLAIPSLTVDALVEHVGVTDKGAMDVPKDTNNVAWYQLGPKPGQAGNAVIAGHLDNRWLQPAVFSKISSLEVGQEIIINDEKGGTFKFITDSVKTYQTGELPLNEIFKREGDPRLVLITCGGSWSWLRGEYSERVVVFASLIEEKVLPSE